MLLLAQTALLYDLSCMEAHVRHPFSLYYYKLRLKTTRMSSANANMAICQFRIITARWKVKQFGAISRGHTYIKNSRLVSSITSKLLWNYSVYFFIFLYFSILSHACSWNIAGTCDSYFDKICKLNNTILRILHNKHLYFPVVELYKNFNALPPLRLHEQQIFM